MTGIVRSVSTAAAGMQTHRAIDDSDRSDASARAATVDVASQRRPTMSARSRPPRKSFQLGRRDLPPGRRVQRHRQQGGGEAERTNGHVRASTGAEKIGEVVKLIH